MFSMDNPLIKLFTKNNCEGKINIVSELKISKVNEP